jgi:hypothetical protein
MNPQPSEPSETDKEREILLKQFRAYLHFAITAHQIGQAEKLKAMPGPNMTVYCKELAKLPDNTLAIELATPVTSILYLISEQSSPCEGILLRKDEKSVALHATAKRILEQIDLALGFILRNLNTQLWFRGEVTKDTDLLCALIGAGTKAGARTAQMVRRYQQLHPEDDGTDLSFAESYAWDVYQRVAELDKLADEFPDQIRNAARQMHAWPMLMHRHTNNRRRFQKLAKRLELGAEYPTDASEGARFRPDTPMVQYLDPLIYRVHILRSEIGDRQFDSVKDEQDWLCLTWWSWPEERPGEEVLAPLRAARQLPPLTKATAAQWTEKVIVPLILATDARDYENCTEPVLQKIARQKGVKSNATFKSRLLAAVAATLRRLARSA